jgi:hypothetical protein
MSIAANIRVEAGEDGLVWLTINDMKIALSRADALDVATKLSAVWHAVTYPWTKERVSCLVEDLEPKK